MNACTRVLETNEPKLMVSSKVFALTEGSNTESCWTIILITLPQVLVSVSYAGTAGPMGLRFFSPAQWPKESQQTKPTANRKKKCSEEKETKRCDGPGFSVLDFFLFLLLNIPFGS